ncbi:MAG: PEFG-CTERM domain-containing protein, partial [Nitrosopumilus sp.]|nr:PEFG-CTERM domain-containing protein [Nitrosopumilus sp.]
VIQINTSGDVILTINPSKSIIDGVFMVLVDGEEWDDAEYDGNKVTVKFPAGTEEIEIIGTFVIPEFGTRTGAILAITIVSIIILSMKSKILLRN